MSETERKAAEEKVLAEDERLKQRAEPTADERAELKRLFARLNNAFLEVEYVSTLMAEKVAPQFKGFFLATAEAEKQRREQTAIQKSEVLS